MNNLTLSPDIKSTLTSIPKEKKRLDYLDAMRGFTMFLVVLGHVCNWTLGLDELHPTIPGLILYFRMPLFFFISGFIGFKAIDFWDKKHYGRRLLTKAKVQLIPTIVFFSIIILLGIHSWAFPGGYWFTLVLFEMFLVYFSTSFIWKHISQKYYSLAIIGSIVFVFAITVPLEGTSISKWLVFGFFRQFYPFFVVGLLTRKYQEKFLYIMSKDYVVTSLIFLSILLAIIFHKLDLVNTNISLFSVLMKIEGVVMLFVVFNCFFSTRSFWSKENRFAYVFRWVGRRTLDIYMLHYFFVFPTITSLKQFLVSNPNEILILLIASFFTIIIMAMSLLISSILRTSNFLSNWLFGVRQPSNKNLSTDTVPQTSVS